MSPAKSTEGLSGAERDAVRERAAEVRKAGSRKGAGKAAAEERDCLAKIAEMEQPDRGIAEKLHAIVAEVAPDLAPKTFYGQPAYARDGKVVLFFMSRAKSGTRYATLGFNDRAALDDGGMWATSFALTKLGPAERTAIADLVRRAVG